MSSSSTVLRSIKHRSLWQRRWAVVWNAGADLRSDPEWLAFHLPRFGFDTVCVKVCDGSHEYHGSAGVNLASSWLAPLRAARLRIAGWGYLYGFDPTAEASLAARLAHELGLVAFVADAEKEFEFDPVHDPQRDAGKARYARSRQWLTAWRAIKGTPALGLTSFGRVDLHRLDWQAWASAGARFCPQAYFNESHELAPALCVKHAATYWDRRLVHPWLGLYAGAAGRPSGAEYAALVKSAGTYGLAVYLSDTASVTDYAELAHAG